TSQVVRNMRSIGLDLQQKIDQDLLHFHANRPTLYGLERHLLTIYEQVEQFQPHAVILDPISALLTTGHPSDVKTMLSRLVDLFKGRQITALFTLLADDSSV